ncbi:MAG: hypothetical protein JO102_04125 [Elusimicrobia bacterium]|nr:hypothetical protein [Elusimicrobiota bacterium]
MSIRLRFVLMVLAAGLCATAARAYEPEPEVSTMPIGSSFYRHLAFDFGLDLRDLVKLEKRGFGRNEVVTLVLISKATGTNVKEYAKRRLKDEVELKTLAAEAGLDYPTLMKNVTAVKEGIENKGDQDLPPPVFEPSPSPEPIRRKKGKKDQPSPTPPPPASTGAAAGTKVVPLPAASPAPSSAPPATSTGPATNK